MKPFLVFLAAATLLAAPWTNAEVRIAVGHNDNDSATRDFQFNDIPPVSASDAAASAKFAIVDGKADHNSGGLDVLHDGLLPGSEDDPGDNFFFEARDQGGRLMVDLGTNINVKQVNTYSWHPSTRGPQRYKLYASDGSASGFITQPKRNINPEACGWKLLASVDTVPRMPDDFGGQCGVSISDSNGLLGQYRYLLFDIAPTETNDPFGNTFYSEIDVVDANAPQGGQAPQHSASAPPPMVFKTADGYCEFTIQAKDAPRLRGWAETNLAPVLSKWYPKIVALLPSAGYAAPTHFSLTLKPMDGVAFTAGRRVVANSDWLEKEIGREAVGSLVHEAVHVVQQFGGRGNHNPGWLVEGSADYIRWFLYEPQSHGADITWLRHQRHFSGQYDAGYRVTANFLNWVAEKHDANIVTQMNAAMRDGKYEEGLWQQYTGEPLAQLGAEWKKEVEAELQAPAD